MYGDIDPQQQKPESVDGNYFAHRVHKREPFYKNNIFPGELIEYRLPNLEEFFLIPQGTWCSMYDFEFTGIKDPQQSIVWNLEKSLIDMLRVKIRGVTVLETDNYRVIQNYLTIHKTKKELKQSIFEGVQDDADLKVRIGAETTTMTPGQKAIKNVYGKRFKLNLNMLPLFTKVGPIYPHALKEVIIEIRFATPEKVIRGSTKAKIEAADKDYGYKLSNITHEWDEFKHPYFAGVTLRNYRSSIKYKKIRQIPIQNMLKSDKLINLKIHAPGSISGFLILMVDKAKRADYSHDTKLYYNPNFTKVSISYKGSSHRIYENGLLPQNTYEAMLKLVPNTSIEESDFHSKGFGLWIDTRLSSKNELHGAGYTFNVGDDINIAIHRPGESGNDPVNIYTYIFEDATLSLS